MNIQDFCDFTPSGPVYSEDTAIALHPKRRRPCVILDFHRGVGKYSNFLRHYAVSSTWPWRWKNFTLPKGRDIDQVKSETSTTKLRRAQVFQSNRLFRLLHLEHELRSSETSVYRPYQIRDSHRKVLEVTSPLGYYPVSTAEHEDGSATVLYKNY